MFAQMRAMPDMNSDSRTARAACVWQRCFSHGCSSEEHVFNLEKLRHDPFYYFYCSHLSDGQDQAQEPIAAVTVSPEQSIVKDAAWNRPITIASSQDAAACFSTEAMNALGSQVDFEKQFLLVFAWKAQAATG